MPHELPPPTTLEEAQEVWNRYRRRERQWAAVRHVQAALFARTRLDELEREALAAAIHIVEASAGTIYVHEPGKQALAFTYVVGETTEITQMLEGRVMFDDQGVSGEVFRTGVGRITPDVSGESRHNPEIDADTNYQTLNMATVPCEGLPATRWGCCRCSTAVRVCSLRKTWRSWR